jgi:hypothetical protein
MAHINTHCRYGIVRHHGSVLANKERNYSISSNFEACIVSLSFNILNVKVQVKNIKIKY